MIVYPINWFKKYEDFIVYDCENNFNIIYFIKLLKEIISDIGVNHLAYSGGIDSTILLCLMSNLFDKVSTYTISHRRDHKDILFAKIGSDLYKSQHHEFIVTPNRDENDKFGGDDAVRQLFENMNTYTDKIICGDGIDEFMCGYYAHMDISYETYIRFLKELLPNHLIPLDKNSYDVKVFLPYLNDKVVDIMKIIPLTDKVDRCNRKKIMISIAKHLNIPESIIYRNKYGFVDAFIEKDK